MWKTITEATDIIEHNSNKTRGRRGRDRMVVGFNCMCNQCLSPLTL